MNQKTRIWIGLGVLALVVLVVVGVDALQRRVAASRVAAGQATQMAAITLQPGSIPIYWNGVLSAAFSPADLDKLEKASFVEPVEGKTEEGWLLRDVLLLYLPVDRLQPGTQVIVSSSSRGKSVQITWPEIDLADNMVMFDLAGRGTLKLVSKLEKLDTREEWVQDVDKIEVNLP